MELSQPHSDSFSGAKDSGSGGVAISGESADAAHDIVSGVASLPTSAAAATSHQQNNAYSYPSLSLEEERAIEQLWFGLVPVVVTLAKKDIASVSKPDEIYLMCPRSSYIALVAADSVAYFREYTAVIGATGAALDSAVWFEDEQTGAPLKSHLPVGVLFDALASGSVPPWRITIHFSNYPATLLVKAGSPEAVEKRYFQSLKQALHLMQGNVRQYTSMGLQDQQLLWKSVRESDWSAVQQLYTSLISNVAPRCIPVRCVVVPSSLRGSGGGSGIRVLQRPIPFARTRKGKDTSAAEAADDNEGDASEEMKPDDRLSRVKVVAASDFPLVTLAEAVLAIVYPNSKMTTEDLRRRHSRGVMVQGLTGDGNNTSSSTAVPWDADIHALWRMCSHPDMFLYVCIFEE